MRPPNKNDARKIIKARSLARQRCWGCTVYKPKYMVAYKDDFMTKWFIMMVCRGCFPELPKEFIYVYR